MKVRLITAALLAGVGLSGSTALAGQIGFNFINDGANDGDSGVQNSDPESLSAGEVAGAPGYAQGNWNNLGRWGNLTLANDGSGVASGVQIAWDSNNTWNNGVGVTTADRKLMNGYLDSNGGANSPATTPYSIFADGNNKPQAYITGISAWLASQGALTYSVVIYADGDGDGRIGEYWLQTASGGDITNLTVGSDLTTHLFMKDIGNFAGTYNLVDSNSTSGATAETGNYLVFTGLTADSFLLRTEENNTRSPLNAVQIIATPAPEPGTVGLVGMSLAALLGIRRRRREG